MQLPVVIPAKAGLPKPIQCFQRVDPRLRGDDNNGPFKYIGAIKNWQTPDSELSNY